ncbi:MAG TPA: VWA domain-containing protein [Pyrinomonadaceae bacterium]
MRSRRSRLLLTSVVLIFIAFAARAASAQTSQEKPTEPSDDVIRVETNLVQTDVTVIDKKGHVVTGLKPDQFELRVDSKTQPLSFVEEVIAGGPAEETQLKNARDGRVNATPASPLPADSDRRPLIFFFVDDVHLAPESWARARALLLNFLDRQMKPNDRVAVVSTSGQIGFLQQLTDNKAVLREAIRRLNPKYNPEATASKVTISESDANMVANHSDQALFDYLVAATMREYQMQDPFTAMTMVKNRVQQINQQGEQAELATLSRLENLIRSTEPLQGRKVVFFVSDGFIADIKRSNGAELIKRIAKRAAATGVVIHSLDTRPPYLGSGADVSSNNYPDFSGGTAWRTLAENKGPQEPLETLAELTGGRSYLNANALREGISEALTESSAYYLLGWRPDREKQQPGRSTIQVSVIGHPDLKVRTRRNYFDFPTAQPTKVDASTAADQLKSALGSLYARRDVPTAVSAAVGTTSQHRGLAVSMTIDASMLTLESENGKESAIVDVLGAAIDDQGLCATFKQKLEIPRELLTSERFIKWKQFLPLPAGLYQVRVAVRDGRSGRTGSAMTWIEVPKR